MRRCTAVAVVVAGLVCYGCNRQRVSAAPEPSPKGNSTAEGQARGGGSGDRVIARANGREITLSQLQQPLIEAHGLNMLLNLVQFELAREQARKASITILPEDISRERELTIRGLFPDAEKDQYELLFEQFLQQQRISPAEFDIVLETNANLRKVIEPQVVGKITEENLQEAFKQQYGETVRVRHIQCTNLAEVMEVKQRLAAGEAFEQVARALSRNARTGPLGGELPPFSRATGAFPQAFRDAAFGLQEGDVSDPVQADGFYHLIKLEQRIKPKAVEFENVKDSLREDLQDKLVQAAVSQLRNQLAAEALRTIKIEDPVLREQFARKLERREAEIRDEDQIRKEWERRRQKAIEQLEAERAATQEAATQPDAADLAPIPLPPDAATVPATQPATTQP